MRLVVVSTYIYIFNSHCIIQQHKTATVGAKKQSKKLTISYIYNLFAFAHSSRVLFFLPNQKIKYIKYINKIIKMYKMNVYSR